ncbi:hypothetical protein T4A_13324, partial [Trichinella pseudospiralis]
LPSLSQLHCLHLFDAPLYILKHLKSVFAVWTFRVFLAMARQTAFLSQFHQCIRVIVFHMSGLATVYTSY